MNRVPLFVEVIQSAANANVQVCRKIMAELFRQKIAPLPFASNLAEANNVLAVLKARGATPGIVVINTLWAEELIEALDGLIGQTPVVFLMRELATSSPRKSSLASAVESGLRKSLPPSSASLDPKKSQMTPAFDPKKSALVPVVDAAAAASEDKLNVVLKKMTARPNCTWTYGSVTAAEVATKAAAALVPFLSGGHFNEVKKLADALVLAPYVPWSPVPQPPPAPEGFKPKASKRLPAISRDASAQNNSAVHGLIEQLALSTLLTMLEMERKTGVLQIYHEACIGRVVVRQGRIIYADIEGLVPAGSDFGTEAIYHLLTWKQGRFDFIQQELDIEDQIKTQTTHLLMEGARRMDQSA